MNRPTTPTVQAHPIRLLQHWQHQNLTQRPLTFLRFWYNHSMRPEIGVTLRLLLNADNTIPKDGRIQRALDVLNGEDGDLPEIVSVAKMAEKLHKSTATVYNLIESGLLARVVGKGGRTLGIARDSAVFFLNGEFKKK